MARPKKEFNQKQFEAMCAIQCTEEEICGIFDCDDVTLNRWCKDTYGKRFSEVYKQKRQGGKMSLRRKQWEMAGMNPTMAIWLGKQWLGQTDKVEQTVAVISDETRDEIKEFLSDDDGQTAKESSNDSEG